MEHFDYSEVKDLFHSYRKKFSKIFTSEQTDLAKEFSNRLSDLQQISIDIINLNSQLTDIEGLIPNEKDEIEFAGFKIKLQRADPNTPIQFDNITIAYSRGDEEASCEDVKSKEKRLERLASEFFYVAHRIAHIAKKLPGLKTFKAKSIRTIRNKLIEHPEGVDSGVTHDSFSYSRNEGPYVKGLRVGDKTEHMDSGFKANSNEFLDELKKVLSEALAQ